MAPYSVTTWVNDTTPAMTAANLNHLTTELKAQALAKSVAHTLPTWVDGSAPAITDPAPLNEMERVTQVVAASLSLSYTPTAWNTGWTPPRNATRLNHLEAGAQANRVALDTIPIPPGPTPVYTADFETGDFSQVLLVQQPGRTAMTVSAVTPLEGTYSALVKNQATDVFAGGQRSEINIVEPLVSKFGGGSLQGKETWVTWKQKLDVAFEVIGWCVITQFHGGTGSPVFAVEADGPAPGSLDVIIRGGAVNANYRLIQAIIPVPRGQLLSFKVHHLWSTGGGGHVDVWINGVKYVNDDGPNLYVGYEGLPYHKAGIYRQSGMTSTESSLLLDGIRYYTTDPG